MRQNTISIREMAAASQLKNEREYWLDKLSGPLTNSSFPYDGHQLEGEKKEIKFTLPGQLYSNLATLSKNSDYKLHMILTAAVMLLLEKYTGNNDIIIASPVYKQQTEGRYINTLLLLRNNIHNSGTFKDLLLESRQTISGASKNQNFPLPSLFDQLDVTASQNTIPFDVALLLENIHDESHILQLAPNVIFSFYRADKHIEGRLRYNSSLYREETAERIVRHYTHLLEKVLLNVNLPLSQLQLLTEDEKKQVLFDFNDTQADYPQNKTIHRCFEEQAEKTPHRIAVLYPGDGQKTALASPAMLISYKELNETANRTAHLLRDRGVGNDSITGIMGERSIQLIAGILGILKAGGIYLPIASDYPRERIKYMLADSGSKVLLITDSVHYNFDMELEIVDIAQREQYPPHPLATPPDSRLAYVIYTSGSTGKPKGVLLHQSGVRNRLEWMKRTYELSPEDRVLHKTSICFDVSVWEYFSPLLNGAVLVLAKPGGHKDSTYLLNLIIYEKITITHFIPSMLNVFLQEPGLEQITSLRLVIASGEALVYNCIDRFNARLQARLDNLYGPTEASIEVTRWHCDSRKPCSNVPIGKPIANTRLYILDSNRNPVPPGISGEIHIGGVQVAQGYLNRPELTMERFLPDPFVKDFCLYKTGDLGRWLPDGNIEYLGRMDHQIKIRGFRIELDEIKHHILKCKIVKDAVVIAASRGQNQNGGDKFICCYWVAMSPAKKDDGVDEAAMIKEYLTKRLPVYMVPAYFKKIDSIPLTPGGKIDRKQLPEPTLTIFREYVAPRDRLESKLREIWQEVLNLDSATMGIDDNFFQLGGDSLKAAILISKLHRTLDISIPMPELFKNTSIRHLAARIKQLVSSGATNRFSAIVAAEQKEYYPLSPAQNRLYILQRMSPHNTVYNMPQVIRLQQDTTPEQLKQTFKKLIERHEALRTSFHVIDDEPVQKIHSHAHIDIEYHEEESSAPNIETIIRDFVRPFDLSQATLLRAGLIKTSLPGCHYLLLVDLHHIISDATSHQILIDDYLALYTGKELPPLTLHYKDYVQWRNGKREKQAVQQQEKYWLTEFTGEIPLLELPLDYTRPEVQTFEGSGIDFPVSPQDTARLKTLVLKEGVTLYMGLLASFYLVLAKISNQEDIIIGSPVAGRKHADLEQIIGMFVNTLALRNFPEGAKTFDAFLREVKERTLNAFENQDYPFEDLVDKIAVNRDVARNPLFDVMFSLQTLEEETSGNRPPDQHSRESQRYDYQSTNSKFDLNLNGVDKGEEIRFSLHYSTKLFKKETAQRVIAYFKNAITAVINNPTQVIAQIGILSGDEKQHLLVEFNRTQSEYPRTKTIPQIFEEQAAKTPDRIAVVGPGPQDTPHQSLHVALSYRHINEQAAALAALLRDKGVRPGAIVALITPPDTLLPMGIMAVLKSGAGYLPIDPENPDERIAYMVEDSEAKVVLTQTHISRRISFNCETLELSDENPHHHKVQQHTPSTPPDVCYMIYTSGTTGKPKGTMVTQGNLVNYTSWFSHTASLTHEDRSVLTASFGFDLGYTALYPPLLNGGQVHILAKETYMLPSKFLNYLGRQRITYMKMTPSLFSVIISDPLFTSETCAYLRLLVLGGEAINTGDVEKAYQVCKSLRIINHYGPTEVTIGCVAQFIDPSDIEEYKIRPTIGGPIHNTKAYILDKYLKITPIGVPGELCLSGAGVARGYFKRDSLTLEKFIDNPFIGSEDDDVVYNRIYRTGDLVRRLEDGRIEFLGRFDHQVKIRGYRVELGEIEKQLTGHHSVSEAAVLDGANQKGQRYLCAYVVPAPGTGIDSIRVEQLKTYLSSVLPDYMAPTYFMPLEQLPLTPNGKLDRKALPKPTISTASNYVAPRDDIERQLTSIWAAALNIGTGEDATATIGIHDNFFHMGGHSLAAITVISKIHKIMNVEVPMVELFKTPTIEGLAGYIRSSSQSTFISIQPVEVKPWYPLSSAQKRMYILQQMDTASTAYNMPKVIPMPRDIQKEDLKEIFKKLINRHESLRTSYPMVDGEAVQKVHEAVDFSIDYFDVSAIEAHAPNGADEVIKSFKKPFDLAVPPLFRLCLIKIPGNHHLLVLDMHHIISDAASHKVIERDFAALYSGGELPPLRLQYKDYAQWQNQLNRSGENRKQEEYWLNVFQGEIPLIRLPYDYPRPPHKTFEGNFISFRLNSEETHRLENIARQHDATLYMAILTIYTIFLSKLSRQDDIVVGSAVEGRKHADLENIVGIFVNTLALRNSPRGNKMFNAFLKEIKQNSLEAFENQNYQFEDLVEKVAGHRDPSRNPLFDVSFAFQDVRGNAPAPATTGTAPLETAHLDVQLNTSKFDLTLTGSVTDEGVFFTFLYATDLFKENTIRLFAAWFKNLISQIMQSQDKRLRDYHLIDGREKELFDYLGLSPIEIEYIYPATPTQLDIYLDCAINPNAMAHRMVYYYPVNEPLDENIWRESLAQLYRLYPSLRMELAGNEGNIYLAIKRNAQFDLEVIDLTSQNLAQKDILNKISQITGSITHALDQKLVKHYLLKASPNHFINMLSIHHIIFDGPSLKIMFEKWHELYNTIATGQLEERNYIPNDHQVFVNFNQSMIETFDTGRIEKYWRKTFSRVEKLQHHRQTFSTPRFVSHQLLIPREHLDEIRGFCQSLNISIPLYFKSIYALLLRFHLGVKQDFIVREIFGGRDQSTRDFIGCFFHTVPIVFNRNMFLPELTVSNYFEKVFGTMMKMSGKQYISIFLQNKILGEESMTFYYNYRNFLTLDTEKGNYYLNRVLEYTNPEFHPREVQLITKNIQEGFFLELDYNESYFNGAGFLDRILYVSRQVAGGVETLPQLSFLPPREQDQVLSFCTGPSADFPSQTPLFQLFSRLAQKEPGKIALVYRDIQVTYGLLNERSGRLARYLADEQHMAADRLAAVMMDRSPLMVESILAAWKTGGAYIPIDPQYPVQRITGILNDSNTTVLLTHSRYFTKELTEAWQGNTVVTDQLVEQLPRTNNAAPDISIDMHNLAYVIYTSGSTGKPKGAMVEHLGMMNHIQAKIDDLQLTQDSIVAQNASHTFDISIWQFFVALAAGGRTVIYPEDIVLQPGELMTSIRKDQVTIFEVVPSYLSVILEISGQAHAEPPLLLDYLLVTGETVKPELVKRWFESYPGIKMMNAYGPTEASDDITHYVMDKAPASERISIGRPLQNLNIYIVDEHMRLCPAGVKGEICVSGVGVGRGYLGNESATAAAFMVDPFAHPEQRRLYKTGDLGCWLPDGCIDFFGRKDYQVKIRGFRIELGEIECKLASHSDIKEAVVIDREMTGAGNEKYLCAYFTSGAQVKQDRLAEYLAKELPDYMIPSRFVQLDSIPLTPNLKVDRKALPEPEEITPSGESEYAAPGNHIEQKLVNIWEKVLGKAPIGVNDNFFQLGGDSIKAIQIASRMTKAEYKLAVKDIFQNPVISKLAAYVGSGKRTVDQSPVTGIVPLTPIQHWFFQLPLDHPHHFNQALMLYAPSGFQEEALNAVFDKLHQHHDALRMCYRLDNGHTVQTSLPPNSPGSSPVLQVLDFRGGNAPHQLEQELQQRANEIQTSINLQEGPLFKQALCRLDDGDRLLMVSHHLIIDTFSWRILLEDFNTLYRQFEKKEPLDLPLKTDSFKRWSEVLSQYAESPRFLEEKEYWAQLESTPAPPLPRDFDEEKVSLEDTQSLSFHLDEESTRTLLTKVNRPFGTEINDILLTALGIAFNKAFGHRQVLLALEGHGREDLFPNLDTSRTIGWFTSIYPLILNMTYEHDLSRQIKEVKETLRRVPSKGTGYGILKYLTPEEHKKEITFNLNPRILFNYLGQMDHHGEDGGGFAIAPEPAGHERDPEDPRTYDLNVSGMVVSNRLTMTIAYSCKQYKSATIKTLLDLYKEQLERIISHCLRIKWKELTPGDLIANCLTIDEIEAIDTALNPDTTRGNIKDMYPLSPMQEGLYFHSLLDDRSFAYYEQTSYRLHGQLNANFVEKSLNKLLERHDILKTSFIQTKAGQLLQVVPLERTVEFHYEDISGKQDKEDYIRIFKDGDKQRSFHLGDEVLIRVALFQLAPQQYEFLWSHHHILMDGWCLGILITEFFEIYNSYLQNRDCHLPEAKPYRTYIQWLTRQAREQSKNYWKDYLDGFDGATGIPKTSRYAADQTHQSQYRQQLLQLRLERDVTKRLNLMASESHVTLNTIVRTVWGILLGKYNGKQDAVFGATVSGRPAEIEGVEAMVGLFINTIPVRIRFQRGTTFKDLLQDVQNEAIGSEPHQYYPLSEIQTDSALKQKSFDHLFVFENFPLVQQIEGVNPKASEQESSVELSLSNVEKFEQTHYDLCLKIDPLDPLSIRFDYNGNIYPEDFILRLSQRLELLFHQVVDQPEIHVSQLTLVSQLEKQRILDQFNGSAVQYPQDKTLHRLFAEAVQKNTDDTAIVDGNGNPLISYSQLNRKADKLAALLVEKGVKPGVIVSFIAVRSLEVMVAIFGIIKAGGAYLPIDPQFPARRIKYMLRDSGVRLMLTHTTEMSPPPPGIEVLFLDDELLSHPLETPNLDSTTLSSHPAYLLYTSGSTGKPKGVLVEHQAIVNTLHALTRLYPFDRTHTWLLKTSYLFDVSLTELFGWYGGGGRLALLEPGAEKDPGKIVDAMEKAAVTHVNFVPSMFHVFLDSLDSSMIQRLARLEYFFLAGEALPAGTVQKFYRMNIPAKLENIYGPTEASVYACYYSMAGWNHQPQVPIGKPLANVNLYILDRNRCLQPVDIPGELYISGAGVARGYLNNPQLTHQTFSPDPFCEGLTMYRTGDLTRWLPDGNILFLGRIDQQVKIRGYRVELGEIQHRLQQHKNVSAAVVVVKETDAPDDDNRNPDSYLCAYVVLRDAWPGKSASSVTRKLKDYLARFLPTYMIPSTFVTLDKIPLTNSGKVDGEALRVLDAHAAHHAYVPPQNQTEQQMAEVWKKFFNIEQVSTHDDFFELGGHSLLVIQMVNRLKAAGLYVTMDNIYLNRTIHRISGHLLENLYSDAHIDEIQTFSYKSYGPVYYKVYPVEDVFYKVLYIDSTNKFTTEEIVAGIKNKFAPSDYPNFSIHITSKKEIIDSSAPTAEMISSILSLKDHVTPQDEAHFQEQMDKNNLLTPILISGKKLRQYPVSIGQKGFLKDIKTTSRMNMFASCDISGPMTVEALEEIIRRLVAGHALLRSIIVQHEDSYMIKEFHSLSQIQPPFIDISNYSFKCKEKILGNLEQELQAPMEVIGHALFRCLIIKLDNANFKIDFAINHIISDAESIRVLHHSIHQLSKGIDIKKETPDGKKDYYDYIHFMDTFSPEDIEGLDNYLNIADFVRFSRDIEKKFEAHPVKSDFFEIDISDMNPGVKNYYSEILMLAYAKLIGGITGSDKVPLRFISAGRNYKDENFNNIIGLFPDNIPYLVPTGEQEPEMILKEFADYRIYVRDHNVNFLNYFNKFRPSALEQLASSASAFLFSAPIGRYEIIKKKVSRPAWGEITSSHGSGILFEMSPYKDLYSDQVIITFSQNLLVAGPELIKRFMDIYRDLVDSLNEKGVASLAGP